MDDVCALTRARAGDADAFRVLVERHARMLFAVACRITRDPSDADDAVQEAFLRAYARLDQFEERSSVSSWLYRIAVNAAHDLVRSRRRRENRFVAGDDDEGVVRVPAADPGPERLVASGEVKRRMERTLLRMSEMERTAFVLRHHEGLSLREIGEVLEVHETAAKQSLFRAVRKLREALRRAGMVA